MPWFGFTTIGDSDVADDGAVGALRHCDTNSTEEG